MDEDFEIALKSVAISNLIMAMLATFLYLRWPFPSIRTIFLTPVLVVAFIIYMVDLWLTRKALNRIFDLFPGLYRGKFRLFVRSYYLVSLLTRLIILSQATYIIDPIPLLPMFIIIPSLMFAFIIHTIRRLPIAIDKKGRLQGLVILNSSILIYLLIPFTLGVTFQGIRVLYIIVFTLGGMFKGLSYFLGAFVFYSWSGQSEDIQHKPPSDHLYPEQPVQSDNSRP